MRPAALVGALRVALSRAGDNISSETYWNLSVVLASNCKALGLKPKLLSWPPFLTSFVLRSTQFRAGPIS
jgi:hypothetical protein